MKTIFLTSLTAGTALAFNAQNPGSRILGAYDATAAIAKGANLCQFKTIGDLFPIDIVDDEYIEPDQDTSGSVLGTGKNYYGGYRTTIKIPGHATDAQQKFKDYEYFLYNSEAAVPEWVNVEQGQTARLGVHITDHLETQAHEFTDFPNHPGGLTPDSFLKDAAGVDITDFPKSAYINILDNVPALQSLATTQPPHALHGSISCVTEIAADENGLREGPRSGDLSSVVSDGITQSCTYSGFQRSWILGVQSLCSAHAAKRVADGSGAADHDHIFAWFKQTEKPRSITVVTGDHDAITVRTGLSTDTSGDFTTAPTEILFAAPNTVRLSEGSHSEKEGIQHFSSVKSVESSIKFGYTTPGNSVEVDKDEVENKKCTTVSHGTDDSGAINLSGGTNPTDGEFNTACKVSGEAIMKVDFRDAPGTESCALSLDRRTGQVELAIVQFARTHDVLILPSLKNNSAHQFVLGAGITTVHPVDASGKQTGFTAGVHTSTTGFSPLDASGNVAWSCLDDDQCELGDPYNVLGVTVTRATVTGAAATLATTITAEVTDVMLVDPTAIGAYSYVMGIADFTISDCGNSNMDDPTQRGEYEEGGALPVPEARRLGAAVSTPGNSVTQLHYASYQGY